MSYSYYLHHFSSKFNFGNELEDESNNNSKKGSSLHKVESKSKPPAIWSYDDSFFSYNVLMNNSNKHLSQF